MRLIHSTIGILALAATTLAAQTRPDSTGGRGAAGGRGRGYVPRTSRADTLRGSFTTPGRNWWDVTFYDLRVSINPKDSTIKGSNGITYRVLRAGTTLQIDLMEPLAIDSIVQDGRALQFRREGPAYFATPRGAQRAGELKTVTAYYSGHPKVALNPPWQGGFTWAKDSLGRPWMVTTDQGMGASAWWPNKDTQADEPDSQRVALTLPDPIINVSNGRLRAIRPNRDGTTTYEWFAVNPINNYAIAVAAGSYAHYSEIYDGVKGKLTLDYWPLDYNVDAAKRQWTQVRSMLACFEQWFGPYPWYEDGYKLIQVPNTGMEHQTAVTYGNWFENGYRRRDGSGTGHGLKWDFIIIHESAHEWWGNNITAKDNADMWVHESFANYAENIYTECLLGKQAGSEYAIGTRRGIRNDRPIIPIYDVNEQGSGDMYPKGGNMLHTIRQIVDNDEKWRGILQGLNKTFWHQTVMGKQVEDYISKEAGINFAKVFDQYLRTTMIPTFEYRIAGDTLSYRWATVVPGFEMPLEVTITGPDFTLIRPTERWQQMRLQLANPADFKVDANYYVVPKKIDTAPGG
jgi:aminopeptidase N